MAGRAAQALTELGTDEGRISLRVKVPAEDGTAAVEMTGPAVPENGLQAFDGITISLGAPGFTQYLRRPPVHCPGHALSVEERGGFSFDRRGYTP